MVITVLDPTPDLLLLSQVRGSGEFGEEFYLSGKGSTKPNTWRDFVACTQYPIDKNYTPLRAWPAKVGSASVVSIK